MPVRHGVTRHVAAADIAAACRLLFALYAMDFRFVIIFTLLFRAFYAVVYAILLRRYFRRYAFADTAAA